MGRRARRRPNILSRIALIAVLISTLTTFNLVRVTFPTSELERSSLWFEPELLAEISYSELMEGWLRDPVYRGLLTPVGK